MADPIKQEILIDINLETDEGQFKKLADLKGTLIGLKTEQKQLEKALKDGAITQKEYNSEIVRVEALQKSAQAQYSQTQRSVTGLKNPINELNKSVQKQNQLLGGAIPALDKVTGGAASAAQGIFTMVKASLAFIATPLGIAITAIGVALLPLISYLKNTGDGADIVTREMEGFKSVLEKVSDGVNKFGREQSKLGTSLLESGKMVLNVLLPGLTLVAAAYNKAAESGREYADVLDVLRDSEENYGIEAAKNENEIKRLLLQAKNRTLSEKERTDLLEKALALESLGVTKRTEFAQNELSAIVERNRERLKGIDIVQKDSETQESFVENNINAIRDFDEALATSLINSIKKLEEAKSSGIAIEEKAQNQLDALQQKAEDRRNKEEAENLKDSEEARKRRLDDFDFKLEQDTVEFDADVEKQEQEIVLNQSKFDALDKMAQTFHENEAKRTEERKKRGEAQYKNEKTLTNARIELAAQFGASLQILAGKNKMLAIAGVVIEKAAAIASIIANTAIANAKAVKDSPLTFGLPWVAINTASAILAGVSVAAQAAQSINQISTAKGFYRGGYTGNGAVMEPAGVVHRGEVVWSQADVKAAGGADRVDRMRPTYKRNLRPYATGGVVGNETRLATAQALSQLDLNQLASLMNQVQTVLVLEQFEAKQTEVNNISRRATVIG